MAGHCTGITEGEIDVGVAVDVGHPVAFCSGQKHGEPTRPFGHPSHRHPADQVFGGFGGRGLRPGPPRGECHPLLFQRLSQPCAIDPGHEWSLPQQLASCPLTVAGRNWP